MGDEFEGDREERDDDDADHDELEVLLDDGYVAEEIAGTEDAPDPDQSADHVEGEEAAVVHRADACHEGGEGADDGNEAGDDDRLAAVTVEELLRLLQVVHVQPADVFAAEDLGAQDLAEVVVRGIAQDGGDAEEHAERDDVEAAFWTGSECADCKEKRVTGKERHDHQAGLAKDDCEEDGVGPGAVIVRQLFEVLVKFQQERKELRHCRK